MEKVHKTVRLKFSFYRSCQKKKKKGSCHYDSVPVYTLGADLMNIKFSKETSGN